MADSGNIFNNPAVVTPSLAGQGTPAQAGNEPIIDTAVAAPDGQAVQTPEPNPTPAPTPEPVAQPQVTDWQAEFKTPEEMYAELQKTKQSYANLRPQFTKVTQELSTLKKGQVVASQPQVDPQAQVAPEEALLNKVAELVRPVKEQNEELMMQNDVARIVSSNPDFMQYANEVSNMLKENPQYWNINNPIETVYRIVKAEKANEAIATATANARNQAYADKELKVLNPAEVKTQPNNPGETKTPEQIIKEGIMDAAGNRGSIF